MNGIAANMSIPHAGGKPAGNGHGGVKSHSASRQVKGGKKTNCSAAPPKAGQSGKKGSKTDTASRLAHINRRAGRKQKNPQAAKICAQAAVVGLDVPAVILPHGVGRKGPASVPVFTAILRAAQGAANYPALVASRATGKTLPGTRAQQAAAAQLLVNEAVAQSGVKAAAGQSGVKAAAGQSGVKAAAGQSGVKAAASHSGTKVPAGTPTGSAKAGPAMPGGDAPSVLPTNAKGHDESGKGPLGSEIAAVVSARHGVSLADAAGSATGSPVKDSLVGLTASSPLLHSGPAQQRATGQSRWRVSRLRGLNVSHKEAGQAVPASVSGRDRNGTASLRPGQEGHGGLLRGRTGAGALFGRIQQHFEIAVDDASDKADVFSAGAGQTGRLDGAVGFHRAEMSQGWGRGALPASVTDQVTEAFRASAADQGRQIVIRLNPPELGKVRITLNASGRDVHGVVAVDNSRTLLELQREAPMLLERLSDAGIQLRRMEMALTDHQDEGETASDSHLSSDGRGGQDWSGDQMPQASLTDSVTTSASELDGEILSADEPLEVSGITEGKLNVWL